MPVPDFQSLMLPLLRLSGHGGEVRLKDARESLAAEFRLSDAEIAELLPSGRQTRLANRVAWAKVHLDAAGLLRTVRRGCFAITERGRETLSHPPPRITLAYLQRFPEFVAFRTRHRPEAGAQEATHEESRDETTPEEALEEAHEELREALARDLLLRLKAGSPRFFEETVVDVLLKMGYGGSRREAGQAVGRSGDEGIDGMISEDRLGLDMIYIQAKRWEGTVGRPEVQRFVGALHGRRAKKGVFITTGTFSAEALAYVENIDPKVVLVDGQKLAEFMIDFGVGTTTIRTYHVKRIDSDYFEDNGDQ